MRRAAARHAGTVAAGRNPAAERRAKLQEATLGALWDSYLDLYAKPRKRSWKDDERMYKKYLGAMKTNRLSAITKAVVTKWHGRIAKEHGPVQANRCKALLATMFSKSAAIVGYTGPNPCIGVANFPERSRERFLLPAEMQSFFAALAAEDAYWQGFFLLCLFTGTGGGTSPAWRGQKLTSAMAFGTSRPTRRRISGRRPWLCVPPPWRFCERGPTNATAAPGSFRRRVAAPTCPIRAKHGTEY